MREQQRLQANNLGFHQPNSVTDDISTPNVSLPNQNKSYPPQYVHVRNKHLRITELRNKQFKAHNRYICTQITHIF